MHTFPVFCFALLIVATPLATAQVTTAFTYQGELEEGGSPATGEFDFEFELFDSASDGVAFAGPVTIQDVFVDGGFFTTEVDFGPNVFGMMDLWLEVRVREGDSSGGFTELLPRQKLTPAPMAQHALNVEPGAVDSAQIVSGAVGSDQIAPGAVGTNELATDSLTVASGTGLQGGGEIALGGTVLLSIADGGVDSAQIAAGAVGSGEVDTGQIQLRIGSSCSAGSSIRQINVDGTVECEADSDSGGDITAVSVTPPGLIGGGNSGDVSVAVDFSEVQARVGTECEAGAAIRSIAQDGSVTCETDDFEPADPDPFDGVLTVGPSAFEESRGHQNTLLYRWDRDFRGWLFLASSGSSPPNRGDFFVPVRLPAGATITKLQSYFYDNDPTGNVQINVGLRKRGPTETEGTLIANAFASTTSGQSTIILTDEDTTINDPVVDKNAFYWLSLLFTVENVFSSSELRFYGARIEYTMP